MDKLNTLFLPRIDVRIKDLESKVENLKARLSAHMPNADYELFGQLLAVTQDHLLDMRRTRDTLAESRALLDACHDRHYLLFRPETAPNLPISPFPQTAAAAPPSSSD
jgi:hypothetical protein